MSARSELTREEVKDALTRLADGIMLDPINRIELRAIAVMLMNDADAVATARYQPTEEDAAKIQRLNDEVVSLRQRLNDEVVSLRMQLNEANVRAEGKVTPRDLSEANQEIRQLRMTLEERDQDLTRIGVVMGTLRTHFRNAETRRREIIALLSHSHRQ